MTIRRFRFAFLLCVFTGALTGQAPSAPATDVVHATLRNGMRVVIVRNAIAPAVSTEMTYLVGSRDDPAGVPGMAHAQEHMMFRGTRNLSTSELGTIATALGGSFNAATSDTLTQYQFNVPREDLDAILRIESDRMREVLDAQDQWQNERGAIEQEVLRDESTPGADFFRDAQRIAYDGTPYGHEGVGTKSAFDRLTGPQIKAFWERWYAPNNALLVIAGDVDPARALEQIRARFESIPARTIASHAAAHLKPVPRTVLKRTTTLIYPLAAVGFRMPGLNDADFLASFVLQGILGAERGPLHALRDTGQALDAGWTSFPYVPEAQLAFATAALPPGADPSAMTEKLQSILTGYAKRGVPRELFETTKRHLIADQEQSRNSIEALASDWSTTIALDREPSIAHEQDLIAKVTLDEVDRVARTYLDPRHAIVGALTPSASASRTDAPTPPQRGPENLLAAQPPVTHLPSWAEDAIHHVDVTPSSLAPTRTTLPNGLTLIVQPETISDSVFVYGRVKSNPDLEEPAGKEGVSAVLDAMFPYGTRTQDRIGFQRALDDADSNAVAGSGFGLQTTSKQFARGVALLAQNQLQPRFDEPTFELARKRAIDELQTTLSSSGTIANLRAARFLLPPDDPELRQPTARGMQMLALDDVRAYYQHAFRPDLTTIVVVGNVTAEAARSAIEREFGNWRASGPAPQVEPSPLPPNRPGEVRIPIPSGQDNVQLQQIVGLERNAPQLYPLLLGNAILGGGSLGPEQSRLFRDLRQNAGLVYTVASRLQPRRSRYLLSIEFACLPSNEGRILSLIETEISRMKTQPVGEFELALAKASIVHQTAIGTASVSAIGQSLLEDALAGYPFDQAQIDARRIAATDAASIQSAFSTYVQPENFVRTILGPQR